MGWRVRDSRPKRHGLKGTVDYGVDTETEAAACHLRTRLRYGKMESIGSSGEPNAALPQTRGNHVLVCSTDG